MLVISGCSRVGQIDDVVAVHVGDELSGQRMRLDAGFGEPDDGAATGVELQRNGPFRPL
jgi:hypothetical protein